jgi:hypothetical protein
MSKAAGLVNGSLVRLRDAVHSLAAASPLPLSRATTTIVRPSSVMAQQLSVPRASIAGPSGCTWVNSSFTLLRAATHPFNVAVGRLKVSHRPLAESAG